MSHCDWGEDLLIVQQAEILRNGSLNCLLPHSKLGTKCGSVSNSSPIYWTLNFSKPVMAELNCENWTGPFVHAHQISRQGLFPWDSGQVKRLRTGICMLALQDTSGFPTSWSRFTCLLFWHIFSWAKTSSCCSHKRFKDTVPAKTFNNKIPAVIIVSD